MPSLARLSPAALHLHPAANAAFRRRRRRPVLCDMRQRDLFPLPFLNESFVDATSKLSRASLRRLQCREGWKCWANDGIRILNLMACRGLAPTESVRISAAGSAVTERITSAYCEMGTPSPELLSSEGALRELLNSAGLYCQERADVCPYNRDLI